MKRMHTVRLIVLGLGLWAGACGETDGNDTSGPNDSDPGDTDGDSDTDTDTDTDGDSDLDLETTYEGFEDIYILTLSDDPEDVCRVRWELHAVGEPEIPCDLCEWDVVVEWRNPTIEFDPEGACANSEIELDQDAIDALTGQRVGYAFAREYIGHANVLLALEEGAAQWGEIAVANYDPSSATLTYDRRDGTCTYGLDGSAPTIAGICGFSGEAEVSNVEE